MFLAFFALLVVTASGSAITYLFQRNAPLIARAASGAVVGQVLLGLVGFVAASFFGMSAATVWATLFVCALPLLVLRRKEVKQNLRADISVFAAKIRDFTANPTLERILLSLVYLALICLLWAFFDRAMLVMKDGGIGIGAPNNLGDLAFHLENIYGFTDGQNFPPQNPGFAGTKFTYPFIVNMTAAVLIKLGANMRAAIFLQNIVLAAALVRLLHHFTFKLTNNSVAAHIAPFLVLFSGGIGFVMFFRDAIQSEQGIFGALMHLQIDYTLRPETTWRWGNTLTVLFITQRSILLGLPLALTILAGIWNFFFEHKTDEIEAASVAGKRSGFDFASVSVPAFVLGLLAGSLPLVHAHTFAVVMGVAVCYALMSLERWREWAAFFAAAGLVAVPELLWAISGTATHAENFLGIQFGWDKGESNFVWFWLKNTGLFFPLLFAAILLMVKEVWRKTAESEVLNLKSDAKADNQTTNYQKLLLFWLPFALCFVIPNLVKLAPWIWDNIKVLVYWFVASVPLVALILARIWERGKVGRIAAGVLILGLTFAGALDVWRVASHQFEYQVFEPETVALAQQIRQKTAPESLILSAPAYNSPVVLTGRRWFMGFSGHLWSHGINPSEREEALKRIYAGTPDALELLKKNRIEYVIVSPLERESLAVDEKFFTQFPVAAEVGDFRVYKIQ